MTKGRRQYLWWGVGLVAAIGCGSSDGDTTDDTGDDTGTDTGDACTVDIGTPDDIPVPANFSPRWTFEPWISKDISDSADTYEFVEGFLERDIPVGAVVIDSPWETHYNTFIPNPDRYPDFETLVDDMHAQDVRVVMWITQMVNTASLDLEIGGGDEYEGPSPNYDEGAACGFFVNENRNYLWWKGAGSGLDFFNPEAVTWWHRQQDAVLDMGIDGWKLDFGDEYIPGPTISTAAGGVDKQAYSEAYYRDFFAYGVHKRGREFVTMSRPYDESYGFEGRFFARPEHAPVLWVGDNRRDFVGLIDALDHIFRSARAGYVNVGSDIGGYLDFDDLNADTRLPFDTLVFARWTAVAAFHPFFQLHGRANQTPWTVPDNVEETVTLYRYYATLHHELVPFFYSLAQEAYAGADVIVRPVGDSVEEWTDDWRFGVGDAFLVAPIVDASGVRDVELPAGTWYDWFDPAGDAIAGGQTLTDYDATARINLPVFARAGAIVPAHVDNDVTGLGTPASDGALTVLVYPSADATEFPLHDSDDQVTEIEQQGAENGRLAVTMSRVIAPTIIRARYIVEPGEVTLDDGALEVRADRAAFDAADAGWFYDAQDRFVWVKFPAQTTAASLVIEPAQ